MSKIEIHKEKVFFSPNYPLATSPRSVESSTIKQALIDSKMETSYG